MGDLPALEGLATALYERLDYDPEAPQSPVALARRWLGADAIVHAPATQLAPAITFLHDGRRRISVKRSLPPEYRRFAIGHELGHVLLLEAGSGHEDGERAADYLGAALMAPRPAVRLYGDDWRALAEDIGSTQTQAALRTAEVLHVARAVVTPHRVYLRGPDGFVWPLARRSIVRMPGIRKTVLDDDPERVVVDVDDVG